MIFSVEDRLFDFFPDLRIGVLVARVDNTRYGNDVLEPVLERTRIEFRHADPADIPAVREWKDAFAHVGMAHGPYASPVDSLLRRVLGGGIFPRVNPLVDLYTAISLEFLVPLGGHDISSIDGNPSLGFAKGRERFTPMEGGEEEVIGEGEVIYKDDCGALTRGWVWRQSNKVRISADTRLVLMPVDVLDPLALVSPEDVMDRLHDLITTNLNGDVVYRNTVSKDNRVAEFFT